MTRRNSKYVQQSEHILTPFIKLNYQLSSSVPLYPYKCEIDSKRGHQHDVRDI